MARRLLPALPDEGGDVHTCRRGHPSLGPGRDRDDDPAVTRSTTSWDATAAPRTGR